MPNAATRFLLQLACLHGLVAAQEPAATAQLAFAAAVAEHGEDSLPAAKAQLALAKDLFRRGETTAAAAAANACLAVFDKHLPEAELQAADALLVLGALAGSSSDAVAAEGFYRRALAIRERTDPPGAPYLQLLRLNLAVTLQQLSDFRGGFELAELGRREAEQTSGAESLIAGNFQSVAALCLDGLGCYHEAYEGYLRAERILRARRGENFPDALRMAGLAGVAACGMGRPDVGLPKIAAALAAMRELPQIDAGILGELRAASVVLRAMHIRDEASHADLRTMLAEVSAAAPTPTGGSRLLLMMTVLGDVDPAVIDLPAARQALAQCEAAYGRDHVQVASMLSNLAKLLLVRDQPAEARACLRRALAIVDATPWFVSTDRWQIQWSMACLDRFHGSLEDSVALVRRSLAEIPRLLDAWSSPFDERQRLEFTASTRSAVDLLLSAAADAKLPTAERWQTVLAWKGLVSRGLLQSLQWLHHNHDPETQRLADELRAAVGRWSAVVRHGDAAAAISKAKLEREAIERELARRFAAQAPIAPDPAAVAAALADDEVLVDFFTYGHLQVTTAEEVDVEERLLAFVVRRGAAPVLVELGPLAAVTAAVEAFLQVNARWTKPITGAEATVAAAGAQLAALVWTPLREQVPAGSRVVVCPDSVIALVPFACLPGRAAGTFLVEEHEFAYLPTAADLIERTPSTTSGPQSLLAVGGVDYGDELPAAGHRDGQRGFGPLPGSGPEVLAIAELFAGDGKERPVVLRGKDATVERFASAGPGATFVHIATHGWFRGSRELPDAALRWRGWETGKPLPEGVLATGAASGIALADANGPARASGDGVLTSDEIALLDLGRCELAVLSACETGLGTVSADGLLGLRRALRLAGARRSLTSVWRVQDEATLRCMLVFYRELWSGKLAPAAALRAAQLAMLRQARTETGQALVGTWGAFVLETR